MIDVMITIYRLCKIIDIMVTITITPYDGILCTIWVGVS